MLCTGNKETMRGHKVQNCAHKFIVCHLLKPAKCWWSDASELIVELLGLTLPLLIDSRVRKFAAPRLYVEKIQPLFSSSTARPAPASSPVHRPGRREARLARRLSEADLGPATTGAVGGDQ